MAGLLMTGMGYAQQADPAEESFNRGVAELEAGRYETACPAIEESYKLDPRPGTLFTLAECERMRGRLATSVRRYDEYLAMYASLSADSKSKQGSREKESREHKAALEPEIPRLTLMLPGDAPKGTVVKMDNEVMAASQLGTGMLVDPGEHTVETEVPSGNKHVVKITINKGESKEETLVVEVPKATTVKSEVVSVTTEGDSGPGGRRIAMLVAGGVGAAGLVVGGIFGGLAIGKKGVVDDNCVDVVCNHEGKVAADSLKTFGLVSTIGFGVGLAGLGTAAVLFFTEPKKSTAESQSSGSRGGVSWRGGVVSVKDDGMMVGLKGVW